MDSDADHSSARPPPPPPTTPPPSLPPPPPPLQPQLTSAGSSKPEIHIIANPGDNFRPGVPVLPPALRTAVIEIVPVSIVETSVPDQIVPTSRTPIICRSVVPTEPNTTPYPVSNNQIKVLSVSRFFSWPGYAT